MLEHKLDELSDLKRHNWETRNVIRFEFLKNDQFEFDFDHIFDLRENWKELSFRYLFSKEGENERSETS